MLRVPINEQIRGVLVVLGTLAGLAGTLWAFTEVFPKAQVAEDDGRHQLTHPQDITKLTSFLALSRTLCASLTDDYVGRLTHEIDSRARMRCNDTRSPDLRGPWTAAVVARQHAGRTILLWDERGNRIRVHAVRPLYLWKIDKISPRPQIPRPPGLVDRQRRLHPKVAVIEEAAVQGPGSSGQR